MQVSLTIIALQIKCRMVIVCLSTTASVVLFLLLVPATKYLHVSPFIALGFCPPSWPSLLHSLGITSLLMTVFYSGSTMLLITMHLICT